jgi:hypothetical protein
MANLLASEAGLQTLNRVACYLARRRMGRHLHRSFMIAFDEYQETGHFSLETMLNNLNSLNQDEIAEIDYLAGILGCHDQLWADQIIHVDALNGDDVTGDGTSDQPYASFAFTANLPRYVFRNIIILIHGDISIEAMNWDYTIGPLGSITISGYGPPEVVTTSQGAGPFTITNVNVWGAPPAGFEVTINESMAVDELYGKWIRMKTGAAAGVLLPIHLNTIDTKISIRHGFGNNPIIGDTFEVVEPPTTVTCQTWNLECQGPKNILDAHSESSRFCLWNMNIDLTGAYNEGNQFVCRNSCQTMLSFVSLQYDGTMSNYAKLESELNQYRNYNPNAETLAATDLDNLDFGIGGNKTCCGLALKKQGAVPGVGITELYIQGQSRNIAAIDCRGLVSVRAKMEILQKSAFGIAECADMSSGLFWLNYVSGFAGSASFYMVGGGLWNLGECWFAAGGSVFKINYGTLAITDPGSLTIGVGAFTNYGFVFGRGNGAVVVNNDPTAITGTLGDIWFAGGVGVTAFPIADAMVTDALGNTFARIFTP